MRNKAAFFLAAVALLASGCASYNDPATMKEGPRSNSIVFDASNVPTLKSRPSGPRTGTVEASVGFDSKGWGTKIKVSQDPLLAATTDTVYWYVDAGNLSITFDDQRLNDHVACQRVICYFDPPTGLSTGVYAYTITVANHPKHKTKTLDPDLDIRY